MIGKNSKVYFEADPKCYTGASRSSFSMYVKGYNNNKLSYYLLVVDKATGNTLQGETKIGPPYSSESSLSYKVNDNQPYDIDSVRYVFAVQNTGPSASIELWWQ